MTPHVIAFNGSPRRGGNTETLLAAALRGVEDAGGTVEVVVINDLRFRPCQNCGACSKTGRCRITDDDMAKVYPLLDENNLFIAATPIYFATVSAQIKALMDRCQALWSRKYVLNRPHTDTERKGIMLSMGGFRRMEFWHCAEKVVRSWYAVLDIRYLGGLFYPGVDARGDIEKHATALDDAFEAGRRLVLGERLTKSNEG